MVNFFTGVIEGFYGRQWSWQARAGYASFLAAYGFDAYIYAPKGDPFLRKQWHQAFPGSHRDNLSTLANCYHKAGLLFGVGLSPMGLFESYPVSAKEALKAKVEQINHLGTDILCILFDDMAGDFPGLAERQLDILADILSVSTASKHIVCPSYYSFDPVLEEVFGAMPPNYLTDIGRGLPAEVDLFWTGNRVISDGYTHDDIDRISQLVGRAPVLWDNYPANDGRNTSSHLHLRPYSHRPRDLQQWVRGHIVNPMNQPELSKLVLASLADIYQNGSGSFSRSALEKLAPVGLQALLERDAKRFQDLGRNSFTPEQQELLVSEYRGFNASLAEEVADWLEGAYEFDPACLTG